MSYIIGCCGNTALNMRKYQISRIILNSSAHSQRGIDSDEADYKKQNCPLCGFLIGVLAGSKDAVCTNCGYKDPCCE